MAKKPAFKKPSLNTQVLGAASSQPRAAWIAPVASVVAIVISLFSLHESHEARVAAFRDELIVRARRPGGDAPVSILKVPGAMALGAVVVPWDILISNTGTSTVSITGYEIQQVADRSNAITSYSGLDNGLVSLESGAAIRLPISLESGKSVRLTLSIGLRPGARAYQALLAVVQDRERHIPLFDAEKLLAKNGIDMYDNPVSPLSSGAELNGWSVDTHGREQVFLLKFRTARGAEFGEVTSWYSLKGF
jgi:hypothetical protein